MFRRRRQSRFIRLACVAQFVTACVLPGIPAAEPLKPPASGASPTSAPLRQVSQDEFEIGLVRLNKARRTVTFPAAVNMEEGLLEYLIVCANGKVHESVLVTEAEPYHIHLAMLFLGAKGAPPLTPEERVAEKEVKGEPIRIRAAWQKDGKTRSLPAEKLVFHAGEKKPMSEGPWTYNGSWVFEGTFLAQRERSIVAIITDHDALVNNPRPGRDNDELWLVNRDAVPPMGARISVTFELEQAKKEPPPNPKSE